jgi:hypothetical protein
MVNTSSLGSPRKWSRQLHAGHVRAHKMYRLTARYGDYLHESSGRILSASFNYEDHLKRIQMGKLRDAQRIGVQLEEAERIGVGTSSSSGVCSSGVLSGGSSGVEGARQSNSMQGAASGTGVSKPGISGGSSGNTNTNSNSNHIAVGIGTSATNHTSGNHNCNTIIHADARQFSTSSSKKNDSSKNSTSDSNSTGGATGGVGSGSGSDPAGSHSSAGSASPNTEPPNSGGPLPPPFPLRVGLVGMSTGLLTPVFATAGVGVMWYRYLPRTWYGFAVKWVTGACLGCSGVGLMFNYVAPWLRDHGDLILPFALANAIVAGEGE